MNDSLLHRYNELMALRHEGLKRYRSNELSVIAGPPAGAYFPPVTLSETHEPVKMKLGPVRLLDQPPVARFAARVVASLDRPSTIVEVGPGGGGLARTLRDTYPENIREYYGVELDASFEGPYRRVDRIADVTEPVDVLIASEVAEHMPASQWYEDFLVPLARQAAPTARAIISVPNPCGPGSYTRDFSHVQPYPWYDLYAIMRLVFENVAVYRTLYVWSAQRLITLLPRMVLCSLMETDWCDNIVCVCSGIKPLQR